MESTQKRLTQIDASKGLLILIVLFAHVPSHMGKAGVFHPLIDTIKSWDLIFIPFFMAGFFIITGYCSNFKKDFLNYSVSNIKTTLGPAVSISFLVLFIESLIYRYNALSRLFSLEFVSTWNYLWFFPALFLSKEVYYILNRYIKNRIILGLTLLLINCIGVYLGIHSILPNHFFFKQSMVFILFLFIGHAIKETKPEMLNGGYGILWIVYPLSITLFSIIGVNIPGIGFNFRLNLTDIPLFILLAITGSIMIYKLGYICRNNRLICYFGQWSGFIYGSQFFLLIIIAKTIKLIYIPESTTEALVFYILTVFLTLLACILFITIFNHKYTKYLLGKF